MTSPETWSSPSKVFLLNSQFWRNFPEKCFTNCETFKLATVRSIISWAFCLFHGGATAVHFWAVVEGSSETSKEKVSFKVSWTTQCHWDPQVLWWFGLSIWDRVIMGDSDRYKWYNPGCMSSIWVTHLIRWYVVTGLFLTRNWSAAAMFDTF